MDFLSSVNPVFTVPLQQGIFHGRTLFGRGPDFNIMERGTATMLIIRAIRSSRVLRSGGGPRSWHAIIRNPIFDFFGKRQARGLDTLGEAQPNPSPLAVVGITTRTGSHTSLRRLLAASLYYQIQEELESIRVQHFSAPIVAWLSRPEFSLRFGINGMVRNRPTDSERWLVSAISSSEDGDEGNELLHKRHPR